MNGELSEINDVFEEGDVFKFELSHFKESSDSNVNKLLSLIEEIEKFEGSFSNINKIVDSELENER